jgi:shikimate dehydrogenase
MLTGATRLVGIIGNPVSHSLSPRMHNAAFQALGLDWAYVPLRVEGERLHDAVRGLAALDFVGANVTIPHKTAVIEFCHEIDDVARKAASVNTLVIRDGHVAGSSTDGLAVTEAVAAQGAHVLVLGAGGAARAVATALLDAGAASLAVAARRPAAAREMVSQLEAVFPGAALATEEWPPGETAATLVVNATPLKEHVVVELRADQQIVDLAYLPDGRETAFVAAARSKGCAPIVDGLDVLVAQGAASFERWTGLPAPVEVMQRAVRELS